MKFERWNERQMTTLAVVVVYAIWVEVIAIRAGEPRELWWWVLEVPFFLWIVAPIVTGFLLQWDKWTYTIAFTAIAGYSLYIYERDMFGPGARSTSALIFIWLPIYQWIAIATILGAVGLARRWLK